MKLPPAKSGTGSDGERLKFLSPQSRWAGSSLRYVKLRGISEFLPQPSGLWHRTFSLKRILTFIWIHPALQAVGNSNLKINITFQTWRFPSTKLRLLQWPATHSPWWFHPDFRWVVHPHVPTTEKYGYRWWSFQNIPLIFSNAFKGIYILNRFATQRISFSYLLFRHLATHYDFNLIARLKWQSFYN